MADITKAEYITVIDDLKDKLWKVGTGSSQGFINATLEVTSKFGSKFTDDGWEQFFLIYAPDVKNWKFAVPILTIIRKFVEDADDWP